MAEALANRPRISDLRGSVATARGVAVLEDPTGRRRRVLRAIARTLAVVLTLWLAALVLGAAGLSPVPGIPFSHALRPATPPAIHRMPAPSRAPTDRAARVEPAPAPAPAAVHVVHSGAAAPQATTLKRGAIVGPIHSIRTTTTKPGVGRQPTRTVAPTSQTTVPASKRPTWAGSGRTTTPGTTTGTSGTTTTTRTTPTTGGRSATAPGRNGTAAGRLRTSGMRTTLAH